MGKVGRPHGLAGAFVVERPSEESERFAVGAILHVDGEPARVTESKRGGGSRVVIRLDRKVERGAELQVPKAELPEPGDDGYYVFQLVGLEVVEEGGRTLGRVKDVASYPANDVLELDEGLALPMVADCVQEIDVEGGRIVVATGFAP
ncbi:MAG: ribosome maturation factor RimM [Actinomycetota bacterium]|nr:ribosome maturation factor RimM [Actinomycetota bacterium]